MSGFKVLFFRLFPFTGRCLYVLCKNSFRTCGLDPFRVENFNFSKLVIQLPKATSDLRIPSTSNVSQQITDTQADVDRNTFISEIEKRICINTLKEFKSSSDIWKEPIKDESLFYFWKKCNEEFSKGSTEDQTTLSTNLPSTNNHSLLNLEFDEEFWLDTEGVLDLNVHTDGSVDIISNDSGCQKSGNSKTLIQTEEEIEQEIVVTDEHNRDIENNEESLNLNHIEVEPETEEMI